MVCHCGGRLHVLGSWVGAVTVGRVCHLEGCSWPQWKGIPAWVAFNRKYYQVGLQSAIDVRPQMVFYAGDLRVLEPYRLQRGCRGMQGTCKPEMHEDNAFCEH